MHLTGYTDVARRQWRVIAVAVLVCVGLALGITELQDRRYRSSVRLLVSGSAAVGAGQSESGGADRAAQRARLFAQIVPSSEVVAAAVQGAGTIFRADVADAHISVTADAHAGSLTITVTGDDPDAALEIAKAYPVVLPGQLARLHQAPAVADALLTIAAPAERASHPSSPRPLRNILAGLGIGVLLGLVAAWLRDTFGAGLTEVRQIAQLVRGNLLAVVPREFDDERVVVTSRPGSRRALGYQEVRATLESGGAPRSLVVTSPGLGEGTSTLAANLALAYSQVGRQVTLVDADLRAPGLPAGRDVAPTWPAKADALRRLIAECDVLVVDAPPVSSRTEPLQLGALTDGIILVTRPGRTTRHRLRRALSAIRQSPAALLGVVVNAAPAEQEADPRAAETSAPLEAAGVAAQVDWQRAELLEQPSPTFAPPAPPPDRRRTRQAGS